MRLTARLPRAPFPEADTTTLCCGAANSVSAKLRLAGLPARRSEETEFMARSDPDDAQSLPQRDQSLPIPANIFRLKGTIKMVRTGRSRKKGSTWRSSGSFPIG